MTFVLLERDVGSDSYRLYNFNQVIRVDVENVKVQGESRATMFLVDGSKVKLEGRDLQLVLDGMYGGAGIHGYEPRSHRPR